MTVLEGGPTADRRWRMVDMRNLIGAMWPGSGTLMENDFAMTPAPSGQGHAVTMGTGRAIAHGAAFRQGGYFAWSDSTEVVTWPGPDAQPRIDTLLLQWFDPSMGATTRPAGPGWLIVPGQPGASPVARTDAAIAASFAEPGAWLRAYDVRINAGQTSIPAANITRRFRTLTSRSVSTRMKMSTGSSAAFRNWAAANPNNRKHFLPAYWDPVEVVVPYTGEVKVTVTGKALNSSSVNAGVSYGYSLSGANTTSISAYADWEFLVRGDFNFTSSTVQLLRGLNPGLTLVTPNLWTSNSTIASGLSLTSGELLVEPVF